MLVHPPRGWCHIPRDPFQTLQDFRAARPALRSSRPTPIEHSPQVVREPRPLCSSRPLWVLTVHDLPHDGKATGRCEGSSTTENFINDHPQGITIRLFCRARILGTGLVRKEKLRAHPSDCAACTVRTRRDWVCGIRHDDKEPEICEARMSIPVNEDVVLEIRGRVRK